jgi:hypothetical protein
MPSLDSGIPHHTFVDESARPGRYLLTAVFVPTCDLAAVTRQVREAFPHGNRRTHMSAEGDRRRRILLRAYPSVQYTHRGSRSEPLLSLPDAIGWAVGAGGMWRRLVEPIVAEVVQVSP